jgi:hypothetical protein
MDVLGDVVARERRSERRALRTAGGRRYSYHDFCTTSYKAGNFLRYLGVRAGDVVGIEPDPLPEPLLTFFGAAQLGAVTRFDPDGAAESGRALVVPVAREADFSPPPGQKLAVYGGSPDGVDVAHWEQEVWSENPAFPPTDVAPEDPVLRDGERTASHADLLGAAASVVAEAGVESGTEVAVRGSLSDPAVVAAGVVAPLLAGGVVVFPTDEEVCDVGVGAGPEPVTVAPDDVSL